MIGPGGETAISSTIDNDPEMPAYVVVYDPEGGFVAGGAWIDSPKEPYAANLNFYSAIYQWLVIAGAKAKYKVSGTINGGGNYSSILTAIDVSFKLIS